MDCNKDCKYFAKLANTDETGEGVCTFSDWYIPTSINIKCRYAIDKDYTLKCKDCERFNNDYACYTVNENDLVGKCSGFIDKIYTNIENEVITLLLQNRFDREKIIAVIDDAVKNFNAPNKEE